MGGSCVGVLDVSGRSEAPEKEKQLPFLLIRKKNSQLPQPSSPASQRPSQLLLLITK